MVGRPLDIATTGSIGTKDVHEHHEEHLANEVSWTWLRRGGERVSLRYHLVDHTMKLRVHRANNGVRTPKEATVPVCFTTVEEARAYAWHIIKGDTQPHGEAASTGRFRNGS